MEKLNNFFNQNLTKIFLVFIMLHPIIDLLTSLSINVWSLNYSLGIIIRGLFLSFLVLVFLLKPDSKDKRRTMKYLLVFMIYLIIYSLNIIYFKDLSVFSYEITNTLRTFYLPILLILVIFFFKEKIINPKQITYLVLTYCLLVTIPTLLNLSFTSYTQGKIGSIGWYNSTNEISGILSILFPLVIYYLSTLKNNLKTIIFKTISILLIVYTFFVLGTKMTIITIFLTLGLYFLYFIYNWYKEKQYKRITMAFSSLVVLFILTLALIPRTNFYKNIEIHLNYLEINKIEEVFTKDNFDHFVFSERLTFLEVTNKSYESASLNDKVIGIGYIENYQEENQNTKIIEMDLFDIFYRHGIIGFSIYIYILYYVLKNTLNQIKVTYLDKKHQFFVINQLLSIFLVFFISILVGHVLSSPAVSIYVVLIFYNLIDQKSEI